MSIGEAKNPGTDVSHNVSMWSQNIRSFSFSLHGKALLDHAMEANVDLICIQKTNLTEQALHAAVNCCNRKGRQMVAIRPDRISRNEGDVAILSWKLAGKFPPASGRTLPIFCG